MAERKHPPVWLFMLAAVPYGVVGSYAGQVMPYLTKTAKYDFDSVGWFSMILFIPSMFGFVFAPLVEVALRRKTWHVITTTISALAMFATCLIPVDRNPVGYMILALVAQIMSVFIGACNGGLMATMLPDDVRGKAGGWLNVGNLSGGALSAAIVIFMVGREVEPLIVVMRSLREVFRILLSRAGISGVLLCLSPVGTAALTNFLSGMAVSYQASSDLTAVMTGPVQSVITAVGAAIGGWLCDRYNRRAMYLASGVTVAIAAALMSIAPIEPATFAWGVTVYSIATGFCYSAFTATVLETIGSNPVGASAKYSLFIAAGNTAITYVGFIDTRFDKNHGVSGMAAADATLEIVGVVVMFIVFLSLGAFKRKPIEVPSVT